MQEVGKQSQEGSIWEPGERNNNSDDNGDFYDIMMILITGAQSRSDIPIRNYDLDYDYHVFDHND